MTCPQAIDELKAIERCARSRGTPACDAIANRLAAVLEDPALLSALEDARRLDWLSDRDQHIGNVMLPTHIVEANVHSLRAAIDAAIAEGGQA